MRAPSTSQGIFIKNEMCEPLSGSVRPSEGLPTPTIKSSRGRDKRDRSNSEWNRTQNGRTAPKGKLNSTHPVSTTRITSQTHILERGHRYITPKSKRNYVVSRRFLHRNHPDTTPNQEPPIKQGSPPLSKPIIRVFIGI